MYVAITESPKPSLSSLLPIILNSYMNLFNIYHVSIKLNQPNIRHVILSFQFYTSMAEDRVPLSHI